MYEPPASAPPFERHANQSPDPLPAGAVSARAYVEYVTKHRNGQLRRTAASVARSNASKDEFNREVEDILQDGLLKAWRYLRTYDPTKCKLSTYILTCIRRAASEEYRHMGYQSEHRQIPFSHLSAGDHAYEPWTDAYNPCLLAAEAEEEGLLRKAISVMPAKIGAVASLRFIDGLTKTAIAERIGISRPTVNIYLAAAAQLTTDLINAQP